MSTATLTAAMPDVVDIAEIDALLDEIDARSEDEWEKGHAHLDARYRAKYKKEAAEYREKFGEEPSLGTLIAAEARTECNTMTEEEMAALFARGMAIYDRSLAKHHATPHARHTHRS